MTVEVTATPQTTQTVSVETPTDYTGVVATNVSGEILRISQEGGDSPSEQPTVVVAIPQLKSITVTQASRLTASGNIKTYQLMLTQGSRVNGSGLRAEDVSVMLDSASTAEIYAADTVTGTVKTGSRLQVRGAAETSGIDVAGGSTLSK